jgi:hypothetical protein
MASVMVKSRTMPDIKEYKTIKQAAADDRVPYSEYWIRRLVQDGTVAAQKIGEGFRSQWLVHMPSLLAYAREMEELGTKKHHPD